MITTIRLDLTADELRTINRIVNGKRSPATRKQVVDFVQRLVAAVVDPACAESNAIVVEHSDDGARATEINPGALGCTTLDHLYPPGPKTAETRCFCGKQQALDSRYRDNILAGRHAIAKGGAQ